MESERDGEFKISGGLKISGGSTAKKAVSILCAKGLGFIALKPGQKQKLAIAYAKRNMIVYGKAFDLIRVSADVDLDDLSDIEKKLDHIVVYEVKSTNKALNSNFDGYFFAFTAAEILVAQSLKSRFKFAFVNTVSGAHMELKLNEIFARAKGIYPTCSVMF